jgi:hypothetical protein
MLAKSEIALLTVSVLGTLAAWLAGPHPLLVTLSYDEHSIARSAPATAFRGIRASLGEENASFAQVSPMFHAFPYLPRTESHRANVWLDEQDANLKCLSENILNPMSRL